MGSDAHDKFANNNRCAKFGGVVPPPLLLGYDPDDVTYALHPSVYVIEHVTRTRFAVVAGCAHTPSAGAQGSVLSFVFRVLQYGLNGSEGQRRSRNGQHQTTRWSAKQALFTACDLLS